MPLDLSEVRGREDVQDRVLTRTDSILPTRRVEDAPSVQVAVSMRSAERGTPEVDELRRTLGLFDQTQSQLVSLQQANQLASEKQNAQIAAGDSISGTVNPELMQKSEAYRMVIANSRAQSAATAAEAEARTAVQDAEAQSYGADPTKGQKVFGLDDANSIIENVFRKHTLDAQGNPIDFGDKSANVVMYRQLQQARQAILGVAAENIRAQTQDQALSAIASTTQAALMKGDGTALETGLKQASAMGIDLGKAKSALLHSALDTALATRSVDPITRALSSTRDDGTPTFNAEEQNTLLTAQHTYATQFEEEKQRQTEQQSMDAIGNLAIGMAQGKRVTPDMVRDLVNSGQIAPRYADTLLRLQFQQDSEVNSRADWKRQATLQNLGIAREGLELKNARAEQTATHIFADALAGGMNGAQLQGALISKRNSDPSFDTDTFVRAMQLAKTVTPDATMVAQYHAGDHLTTLNDALTDLDNTRQARQRVGQHVPTEDQFTVLRDQALFSFYQNLRKGMPNGEALKAALMGTGALSPAQADVYVNRASSRMTANDRTTEMREAFKGQ